MLVARDRVGNQCGVAALVVRDGAAQLIGRELVLDDQLAAPAGVATGQVGLAVAIGVKQLGQGRVGQLRDVGDLVLVGGLLVDQVALQGIAHISALPPQLVVAARVAIEVSVQRVPMGGHEGGITIGQSQVPGGVLGLLGRFDGVAQLLQRLGDQNGLKRLFCNRALDGLNGDALAGQGRIGLCGACSHQRQRTGRQRLGDVLARPQRNA